VLAIPDPGDAHHGEATGPTLFDFWNREEINMLVVVSLMKKRCESPIIPRIKKPLSKAIRFSPASIQRSFAFHMDSHGCKVIIVPRQEENISGLRVVMFIKALDMTRKIKK